MDIYYVYAYIRKSTSIPYYIGKGKGKRAYEWHKGISVPKDRSKIVFLETNLTNVGACALERRYIRWYGRKGIDPDGVLLNSTLGGEGNTGPRSEYQKQRAAEWSRNRKHSAETKAKISANNKGKNTGKRWTEEQKQAASVRRKGKTNHSEYQRQLASIRFSGSGNPNFGKVDSADHLNKIKTPCAYCGMLVSKGNMKRWHGERCKSYQARAKAF